MAGGIDWFRWHHGTVNDQKFPLVARKSGASVAEVIAVWACLLERASGAEERGSLGDVDHEAIDCALGMEEGRSAAIYSALQARNLIDHNDRLTAWAVRQPKREDEGATDRKRAQREREAAERAAAAERDAAANAVAERDKSKCHDTSRDVTTEKRREEENSSSLRSEEKSRKRSAPIQAPEDVDAQVWADWVELRKGHSAKVSATAVEQARCEAAKAGMTLEGFFRVWCVRGSRGLQADWLKPHERAGPMHAPTAAEQRALQAAPSIAAPHLRPQTQPLQFVEEVRHEPAISMG